MSEHKTHPDVNWIIKMDNLRLQSQEESEYFPTMDSFDKYVAIKRQKYEN